MSTPFVPTLSADVLKLTRPTDIIKHVLQHYTHAPKNINDTFSDQEISLIYDVAKAGHDPSAMASAVRQSITTVLDRYFKSTSVDVTTEYNDTDDGYYNIKIDIVVLVDGVAYSLSQDYKTDKDGNLLYDLEG